MSTPESIINQYCIMKHLRSILSATYILSLLVLFSCSKTEDKTVSFETELVRLRTTDHLFQPQDYQRLIQYSGFHRDGQNPDRMHCLYEEDNWRVVADHKGKGVVSRIWTTYPDKTWGDIKVEVDGKVIFEGNALSFFNQNKIPFTQPLTEIRAWNGTETTVEGEQEGEKKWTVSYVPIPFTKRFRFMQREVVYSNINIKEYTDNIAIKSFNDTDWKRVKPAFDKTAEVWNSYPEILSNSTLKKIAKTVIVSEVKNEIEIANIKGKAILRGIKLTMPNESDKKHVTLNIYWDNNKTAGVSVPLLNGFGSTKQYTMAAGTKDNWQFLNLPMPFNENARICLESDAKEPISVSCQISYERVKNLPDDVLYLYSHSNAGFFEKGVDVIGEHQLPVNDFFYKTGYNVLDLKGAGHVVAYMDLFHCQPELDEHIFIDDEKIFPENTWNGTGHEDLFDMAWGHKPLSSPMTSGGSEDFKEVNTKFFMNDPMVFNKAIKFNWEWSYKFGIEPPRDARFASVIYWYAKPGDIAISSAQSKKTQ
ncbi:DUF2961 domain-containing protein [Prolixibacteraceae bacterium JC049]|nr:DUF2961 domain-containing protein [Prolixibacteraceae bacterium JC049]